MNSFPNQNQRQKLRKEILSRRESLSAQDREQKSAKITANLIGHGAFKKAQTIFSYINFRSEVDTKNLIEACFKCTKRLCVPLTEKTNSLLIPYQLNKGQQLVSGYCGIPEPDPESFSKVDPKEIDLIIFPGSVFDHFGGRLGYGGGFYDRFVANEAPNSIRIGLAFDLQVVDKLPLLPHDQPIHFLITESQIFEF